MTSHCVLTGRRIPFTDFERVDPQCWPTPKIQNPDSLIRTYCCKFPRAGVDGDLCLEFARLFCLYNCFQASCS